MSLIKLGESGNLAAKLKARLNPGGSRKDGVGLLMDTSASMSGDPFESLQRLASRFKDVRRFNFSGVCYEIQTGDEIDFQCGGTNMAHAFSFLKTCNIKHCVMITDGQPDDPDGALREAKGLKIDILYVGPQPAPPFLADLANATGGKYKASSLDIINSIENEVRLMIGPGNGSINL